MIDYVCKFIIFVLILMTNSCLPCDKFSSPEQTLTTYYSSIKNNDYSVFYKCFHKDGEIYNDINLKVLSAKLFSDKFSIYKYKILSRKDMGKRTILTVIEFVYVDKDEYKLNFKTTSEIYFINIDNNWKFQSTNVLDIQPIGTTRGNGSGNGGNQETRKRGQETVVGNGVGPR